MLSVLQVSVSCYFIQFHRDFYLNLTLLSSLLKTVKSAEDKASRGTRALEIAVDAVSNDIKALDNATLGAAAASPEVELYSSAWRMEASFFGVKYSCPGLI